jgi:hypothetical protein
MRDDEILAAYLEAAMDMEAAKARTEVLRDLLTERGRKHIDEHGTALASKVPGQGGFRFDGVGAAPRVIITDEEALAGYVAGIDGIDPAAVKAHVEVPVECLAEAVECLRTWGAMPGATGHVTAGTTWSRWTTDHLDAVLDPDTGELTVRHVNVTEDPVTGEPSMTVVASDVPGATATPVAVRLVVTLDPKAKRRARAAATAAMFAELEASQDAQAVVATATEITQTVAVATAV